MPSGKTGNKIYVIGVICIGVVISVWLLERNPQTKAMEAVTEPVVSANSYRNIAKNDDWKSILQNVDSKIDTSLVVSSKVKEYEDSDTLTDQMSRDFLSQYLVAIKQNGGLSTNDASTIANNTLSLSEYTESIGAKYVIANLKITSKTDPATLRLYRNKLFNRVTYRTSQVKDDPLVIISNALTNEDEVEIAKLDYIIFQNKAFLKELLALEVPKTTVSLHLSLLNSSSNLLANLEAMRVVLLDPIKGLAGIGQYTQSVSDVNLSLQKLNRFFIDNL